MREERLLERISRWENGGERTRQSSLDLLLRSILRHLAGILNTQRGSVPIDSDYGLPDLSNLAPAFSAKSVEEIRADIARTIERYEPRLKLRSVDLAQDKTDPLTLRFEVTGSVEVNDHAVPVQLATVVQPNGRVTVGS
jgi:type VI secretion system protein